MMNLNKLTKESLVEILGELIEKLNELDQDDFFGTEGWQHYLGISLEAKVRGEK